MATIGEIYGPAMEIKTVAQAQEYLEKLIVDHMIEYGQTREEATRIQLENIGYYAGYYDAEIRKRVYELFNCNHPIFGNI